MSNLDDVSAEDLLAEIRQRAKEGEIDLTEELWAMMEPDEDQIIELCNHNNIELFDEDAWNTAIEEAKEEGAEDLLHGSGILKLAAILVFASSSRDFIYARDELKFLFQKEFNIHHARLL